MKKQKTKPDLLSHYLRPLILLGLMLITWLVYYPILSNGFINWDDPSLILENPAIRSLKFSSIRHFFISWYLGNYHPLTMLSFSLEYAFFGYSPKGFHIVSLLLHIFNTWLVFLIIDRITGKKILPAVIVALFFAVHPLHLESVAWVTEQKDLLYTFFFLISILLYIGYSDNPKKKHLLILSLLVFILSLLSKGQAVTLPLVLVLLDYLRTKKFTWKELPDKIPFFVLSLVFGIIAIYAQHQTAGINETKIPLTEIVFLNFYGYLVYLVKAIFPVYLSGYHEYPYTLTGGLPVYVYLAPLIVSIIGYLFYRYLRHRETMVFGFLFFTLTLLPLLLLPVGKAYIGERFSYIPYIGLFFMIAVVTENPASYIGSPKYKPGLILTCCILSLFFAIRTYSRTAIWRDSLTYWNDVSDSYPRSLLACEHKAMYHYFVANDIPAAIEDLRHGLEFDSTYATGYRLAGYFYLLGGAPETADSLLTIGLRLDPHNPDIYLYRGATRKALKQFRKAVEDFSWAISLDPLTPDGWNERGIIYGDKLNLPDSAIRDFTRAISLDPSNPQFYNNMAVAQYRNRKFDVAIRFADTAIQKGYPEAHFIKSLSYYRKGDFPMATDEAKLARTAGVSIPDTLLYAK